MLQTYKMHQLKEAVMVELVSSVVWLATLHGSAQPDLQLLEQEIKQSHKGSRISCMGGKIIWQAMKLNKPKS
jgi:hypothetical protein